MYTCTYIYIYIQYMYIYIYRYIVIYAHIYLFMYTCKANSFFTDNVYFETHLQNPIFWCGNPSNTQKEDMVWGKELLVNGCLILWVGVGFFMNVQSISEALYRFVIFWRHVLDLFSACPLCISSVVGAGNCNRLRNTPRWLAEQKKTLWLFNMAQGNNNVDR